MVTVLPTPDPAPAAPPPAAATDAVPHRSQTAARAFFTRPSGVIPLVVLAVIGLSAIFAPLITPYDPNHQDLINPLLPPSWLPGGSSTHLLGTDELGRDMATRLVYGARTALALSLSAATISAIVGTIVGLLAGMYPKWVGSVVMWLADSQMAFPYVVLALVVITVQGNSIPSLLFVLTLFGWVQFARVVRAEVLRVKHADYVLAARAAGSSGMKIVFRHVLPNVSSPALVLWTFQVAGVLLLESALSFLGLGIQPPTADWGTMFASGRAFIITNPWNCILPGLAVMIAVLCANLLGRTLRTVLNPRLR
ncbi:ABC transporter permease subunit [Nakamurella sp. YIM 132087]|uniref:ABC transporter permease subunit n=1 Tax=Nakamurella alba TaxID=2665158 RepID=A0A7K1FNL9_9ACTN|nr:ABC transporter permease [Nakamurella alba]MTD15767.1 ABC transporter permease subunit [Nakamurella alba]